MKSSVRKDFEDEEGERKRWSVESLWAGAKYEFRGDWSELWSGKEKKGSTGTSVFIDLVLLHLTQTCPAYWYAWCAPPRDRSPFQLHFSLVSRSLPPRSSFADIDFIGCCVRACLRADNCYANTRTSPLFFPSKCTRKKTQRCEWMNKWPLILLLFFLAGYRWTGFDFPFFFSSSVCLALPCFAFPTLHL